MMKRVTAKIKLGTNRKTCYIGLRKTLLKLLKGIWPGRKRSFGNNEEEDAGREI
jgi:hypothetical protein